MGCVRVDRPSGKPSVEPDPGPGTAGTPAGSGPWGSQTRHWFLLHLGELRKWFPCSRMFMKILIYTWDSALPVHISFERRCCHLCFMGVCHAGCTHSQNHTPTPHVHTRWPGSRVWRKQRAAFTSLWPQGKISVVPPPPTEGDPELSTHSDVLDLPLKSHLKRSYVNSSETTSKCTFSIASRYLWGANSSTADTFPRTWWRRWSPRSLPTYINLVVLCTPFKGREKEHSHKGMASSHTNPNKQISSRKK